MLRESLLRSEEREMRLVRLISLPALPALTLACCLCVFKEGRVISLESALQEKDARIEGLISALRGKEQQVRSACLLFLPLCLVFNPA